MIYSRSHSWEVVEAGAEPWLPLWGTLPKVRKVVCWAENWGQVYCGLGLAM